MVNFAIGNQLIGNALGRIDRNRKAQTLSAANNGRVDADDLSTRI